MFRIIIILMNSLPIKVIIQMLNLLVTGKKHQPTGIVSYRLQITNIRVLLTFWYVQRNSKAFAHAISLTFWTDKHSFRNSKGRIEKKKEEIVVI